MYQNMTGNLTTGIYIIDQGVQRYGVQIICIIRYKGNYLHITTCSNNYLYMYHTDITKFGIPGIQFKSRNIVKNIKKLIYRKLFMD